MTGRDAQAPTARVAPWNREDAALDPQVRRRIFSARRTLIVVAEAPEAFGPVHTHSVDQVSFVVRGRVEARIGGHGHLLAPGQSVRVPAGVPHALRACGSGGAETVHLFLKAD